jgi:hypothetical protein
MATIKFEPNAREIRRLTEMRGFEGDIRDRVERVAAAVQAASPEAQVWTKTDVQRVGGGNNRWRGAVITGHPNATVRSRLRARLLGSLDAGG